MTRHDHEPLLDRLGRLPVIEPDPVRSERVRAMCRATLAQPHSPRSPSSGERSVAPLVMRRSLTFVLSASYVLAMIVELLRAYERR